MTIFFSKSTLGFYDSTLNTIIPGDAVEITEADHAALLAAQGAGQVIEVDNNGNPVTVPPTSVVHTPAVLAAAALAAGLMITSTSTPSISGTYAVDQLTQMDIIAIETSLNAGRGFPGGATTFNYPDTSGALHAFSETNFTNFAAAVRDYVYGLKSVIAGASMTLPGSMATIA